MVDPSDEKGNWIDITEMIKECAASLSFQEPYICNEHSFSLHDSMAALELMDQKMDCCEIPANLVGSGSADTTVPPRPLPNGLDDCVSNLPWDHITLHETAVIAVEALTRLEALLSGASMPESTYTCMYAHNAVMSDMRERLDPKWTISEQLSQLMTPTKNKPKDPTIPQLVLYATILALVDMSDVVRSIVVNADIYEEEDFSIIMFGLQVFGEALDNEANVVITKSLSQLEGNDSIEAKILRHILQFQFKFLQVCTTMSKLTAESVRPSCEHVQFFVKAGVDELMALKKIQPSLAVDDDETKLLLKRCFDPFVYRQLVGSSPTRKIVYKKPDESIDVLSKVFGEIADSVCPLLLDVSTLGQVRHLVQKTSVSSINILSRSLIVLNLYFDDRLLGQYDLGKLIGQDIQQISAMPDDILESKHGVAFRNRLAKPVYDTLKLLLLNRNRQRTYLEVIMFPEWITLQREAHALDMINRQDLNVRDKFSPFFLQYVLCKTVELMDHFVALGIELELFQGQHDLGVAYWYRDFLLSTLLTNMSQMRQERETSNRLQESIGNGKNGYSSKRIKEDKEAEFAFMMIGFKRVMCRGLVRFIAALNQAGVVKNNIYEFTSHELRFRKRFDHFAGIAQPPPLTYDDFRQGSDFSNVISKDLLAATADCFKQCKVMLDGLFAVLESLSPDDIDDRKEELRKLTKVSVGNAVFLMRLKQMIEKGGKPGEKDVVFDFGVDQFCTIRIE